MSTTNHLDRSLAGNFSHVPEGDGLPTFCVPVEMREFALRAGSCAEPILLLGETGCGKSHLAGVIHTLSNRAAGPLVRVNCGALPESLFEREMFGHVRGAFTDAGESQPGLFEAARGGTLVLDEIGDLPLGMQAKLLDVLESGQIRRLGSTRYVASDVRVIAATNSDLDSLIFKRQFRKDLYYRLAVLRFTILPLRRRRADIDKLIEHLLAGGSHGRATAIVSPEAAVILRDYPWPGNIRELDNALRYARALSTANVIRPENLPENIRSHAGNMHGVHASHRRGLPLDPQQERELIRRTLADTNGNRTLAADRLHVSRSTLWIRMKLYGLVVKSDV